MRCCEWVGVIIILVFTGCNTPKESAPVQSHNAQFRLSRVAAVFFLDDLIADGKVAAFSTNDEIYLSTNEFISLELDQSSDPPPRTVCPNKLVFISRIVSVYPHDEYRYIVSRTNRWSEWRLIKAWKTDEKGIAIGTDRDLPPEATQKHVYQKMLNSKRFKDEITELTPIGTGSPISESPPAGK